VSWVKRKRQTMTQLKNNNRTRRDDIHAYLEGTLIEFYLKSRGHTLEELKTLPEAEVKQLMTEASTYASNKLAEVELRHCRRA
jgi:hypothetical protein